MLNRSFRFWLILVIIIVVVETKCNDAKRPNIIFILADDLIFSKGYPLSAKGWNDVGFHGSNQISTPNIDALAYNGIILNKYYVMPMCTPSRSALLTGKHPIHTGMQHYVLLADEPRGLPLTEKLLPEYLKQLGYTTRMLGKWHLGHYERRYTPTYRGFDSHLGYWTGFQDYFDHTAMESGMWGLDMRNGTDVAWDLHGHYSTDIFTDEAVKIINSHNRNDPLFLYMAHAAVHSGNPYNPLPVSDDIVSQFEHISDFNRRKFAGVLKKLDDSVGQVVDALQKNDLLNNSIIIFASDNGGAPEGYFDLNAASNWPLRGVKNTLFEGGVRGAGLIWSPLLANNQRVSKQAIHISDWLPTLYTAAGGDARQITNIDGIDVWNALSEDQPTNRTEILHNIDDIFKVAALTVGDYKILKGSTNNGDWDGWYGPDGRAGKYEYKLVLKSPAAQALASIGYNLNETVIKTLRKQAKVVCAASNVTCTAENSTCLFNIEKDPCEFQNLAKDFPDIVAQLEQRLNEYNETAIPAANLPRDSRGAPNLWQYTWTNFGDYI